MQPYKNAPPNKRGVWHEGATIDFIRQAWRAIVQSCRTARIASSRPIQGRKS